MKPVVLTLVIVGLMLYVVIGGCIFHALESSGESRARVDGLEIKNKFVDEYGACVPESELEKLVEAVITAHDQGIALTGNATSPSNWDYFSSIFFAVTVVTTIGYGNISPVTSGGMVFCIFFALFGIPLFAVAAGGLGVKLKQFSNFLSRKLTSSCCDSKPNLWQNLRTNMILVVFISLFIFIPSGIFYALEDDWTYAESVYYSFISLTTIGFGDYVAGSKTAGIGRNFYRLALSVWLLFGLAWMASLISHVQEIYDQLVDKTEKEVHSLDEFRLNKDKENHTDNESDLKDDTKDVGGKVNGTEPKKAGQTNQAFEE